MDDAVAIGTSVDSCHVHPLGISQVDNVSDTESAMEEDVIRLVVSAGSVIGTTSPESSYALPMSPKGWEAYDAGVSRPCLGTIRPVPDVP